MALAHLSIAGILIALLCLQSSILLAEGQEKTGTKCPAVAGQPGCVCDHPDGRIDLTPTGNTDGTAKYTGLSDPNNYAYTYNPCNTFTTQGMCTGVFCCQQDASNPETFYDIADGGTEEIYIDTDGRVYLYYTGPQNRFVRVYLTCDESVTGTPKVSTDGDSPVTLSYIFYMTSVHACPDGGGAGGDIAGVVGLVLIFVFLGAIVAYFVAGTLIMKFKFQATGTDIIPNKGFWIAFPLLIKDGFMFTFGPCINLFNTKVRGYNKT